MDGGGDVEQLRTEVDENGGGEEDRLKGGRQEDEINRQFFCATA